MKTIDVNTIISNYKSMKFQIYKNNINIMSAGNRMANNNFVKIYKEPKFKIKNKQKIFTIGSCFAREIEERLNKIGLNIINYEFSLEEKYRVGGRWSKNSEYEKLGLTTENERSILNKYSIRSMTDALDISFSLNSINLIDYLVEYNGLYYNPYQHLPIGLEIDESISLFKKTMSQFMKIVEADIVVITLGQTELWKDKKTNKFINGAPPTLGIARDVSRFEFVIPDFNDVYKDLTDLISKLKFINQNIKIILTVSPVPLSRTFIPEDSITSNVRSKSMLLLSAREAAEKYDFIDYFPSYEMVTHSTRSWAFEPDLVHVMPRCVEKVVYEFYQAYFN